MCYSDFLKKHIIVPNDFYHWVDVIEANDNLAEKEICLPKDLLTDVELSGMLSIY